MKKIENIKQLVDERYNFNKGKTAISINNENFVKNINYFNYKFDIYSMVRALESKYIVNSSVAILAENRYEFMITYLGNAILGNKIIIINPNCSSNLVEKIIRKMNINTLFYSEKYSQLLADIIKLENSKINSKNKRSKKLNINLINFDSENNPNETKYEKFLNTGRYIENYSSDKLQNLIEQENTETIFISKYSRKSITQKELIEATIKIKENLKIFYKHGKRVKATQNINTMYELIVECLLPFYYGISTYFGKEKETKNDIVVESTMQEALVFTYKNKLYRVNGSKENMALTKIENPKKNFIPKFKILKNKNPNIVESTGYGLFNTQDRGRLFIGPGVEVYEGMIVGESSRNEDIVCNVCKKKQMTNTRAAGSDDALRLVPHTVLSLEQCMEFIKDDELLEVTPESLRLRKRILAKDQRLKQQFRKK